MPVDIIYNVMLVYLTIKIEEEHKICYCNFKFAYRFTVRGFIQPITCTYYFEPRLPVGDEGN